MNLQVKQAGGSQACSGSARTRPWSRANQGHCRRAACGRCPPTHGRQTPMPTKAIWEGKECDVRDDTDLEVNWSVSILSGQYDPVSLIRRPAVPVMIKLRAKTRWLAMDAGLRALKAQGKISDYTIEPRPQSELDAEAAEKARLAAKKVAGAKAVAVEEEEEA